MKRVLAKDRRKLSPPTRRRSEELRRREGLRCEARQANGSLKIEHSVDPYSDRRMTRPMRSQAQLGRAFLNPIHIVPEDSAQLRLAPPGAGHTSVGRSA